MWVGNFSIPEECEVSEVMCSYMRASVSVLPK